MQAFSDIVAIKYKSQGEVIKRFVIIRQNPSDALH